MMREALGQPDWKANEDFWNSEAELGDFWNSFGTETAVEATMKGMGALRLKGLGGGRDRTRTCDLLRVKQAL